LVEAEKVVGFPALPVTAVGMDSRLKFFREPDQQQFGKSLIHCPAAVEAWAVSLTISAGVAELVLCLEEQVAKAAMLAPAGTGKYRQQAERVARVMVAVLEVAQVIGKAGAAEAEGAQAWERWGRRGSKYGVDCWGIWRGRRRRPRLE
jgi:hypothetical protein